MKKIAIVTATRAEYSLLTPLIRRVYTDNDLELSLLVTGTHLSQKNGYTVSFIEEDGFPIAHRIPILEDGNRSYDISLTVANAVKGFSKVFLEDRPDMVIVLGDRTEILGVAIAAMNERIPIAHIHGGEITEGAVDDCVRHALSKMSYLHFTSTEEYRKRVIQLGEHPERVFNVGALGTENILNTDMISGSELRDILGIPEERPYVVVTYHPVTLEQNDPQSQIDVLCRAMEENDRYYYVITASNADAGGDIINRTLTGFAESHDNCCFRETLGLKRYLSAVRSAAFVLGNSSSAIIEAPVLGTPTVNIGDRQRGRIMADTVVNCACEIEEINSAISKAGTMPHQPAQIFGDGHTSEKICDVIRRYLGDGDIDLMKGFYNIDFDVKD